MAGSRHCFRCRHSRRQGWIPPSSPSGQQVPGVTVMICSTADTHGYLRLHHQPPPVPSLQTFLPANHLLQRFQEAPTMLPLWMTCSGVNHLHTHKQLQTRPWCLHRHQKQKADLKSYDILKQSNSYTQHSFLKASMVSNQTENKDCIYRLYILPWV